MSDRSPLPRLLRLARRLPVRVVVRRGAAMVRRRLAAAVRRAGDLAWGSYPAGPPPAACGLTLGPVPLAAVQAERDWLLPLARLYLEHRVDLLGSGWLEPAYGLACAGVEGHRYPPGPTVAADPDGAWLVGRINRANLAESRRLWRLVGPGYRPLDWQRDLKSGWRWSERAWSATAAIGPRPGVDIKVPWELARMQHLTVLAWTSWLARAGDPEAPPAAALAAEFRNQILDFLATNPPRFGVNWRCTMDVAIRAANWVVGHALFRAAGTRFDPDFEAALAQGLAAHGAHIVANLEWYPDGRGNHYLANVAGLLFVAAALPASPRTDAWLAFAAQELTGETGYQFGGDGGNFEASVCYHRLSAEMVAYGTALLQGLAPARAAALAGYDHRQLRTTPPLRPGPLADPVPAGHLDHLRRIGHFTRLLTKRSGRVAQIGDNDSGRFLKAHPIVRPLTAAAARRIYANLDGWQGLADDETCWDEDDLDHRPLLAALGALTGDPALSAAAGPGWLDAVLVRALAGGAVPPAPVAGRPEAPEQPVPAWAGPVPADLADGVTLTTEIVVPGGGLRRGLRCHGWPEFGLWLWRSERLFLALRCGAIGHHGRGAHAHNDQLALELAIDGDDWIADPGTYLYTALPARRDEFRSVAAHAAPQAGPGIEPGRLDLGPFWLGDEAQARLLGFDDQDWIGEHQGYGRPVRRRVRLADDRILIIDSGLPDRNQPDRDQPRFRRLEGIAAVRTAFAPPTGVSPGYGKRLRTAPEPLV